MDSEAFPSSRPMVKCCNCECSCSLVSVSSGGTWLRSVKRKYGEFEDGNRFFIPGLELYYNARVQMENECIALRETLSSQQKTIQDLYTELDEERNASSSAANEAMSMILRLQREKAEIQMEARQFKCFVEEKMAHEQQELLALEDLLYKREQAIQALTCEVQAYKHRMMSYGLTESEAEGDQGSFSRIQSVGDFEAQYELPTTPTYEYPPLKCKINETHGVFECDDDADIEKYAFGETPRGRDHLRNLESRLFQMEGSPSGSPLERDFSGSKNFFEKVVVGHSPRRSRHSGRLSSDSPTYTVKETGPDFTESPRYNNSFRKADYVSQSEDYPNARKFDNVSEVGDDMSDRIYTIDSVHIGAPYNGYTEAKSGVIPRGLSGPDFEDPDVMKLYMRLQALEADRESMRQAMLSMRTDKDQLVLLKEIAQHLCNDMSPEKRMIVRKPSIVGRFSSMSFFKWIKSFVFWRRRACRSKHMFGLSANVGLLMLLDESGDEGDDGSGDEGDDESGDEGDDGSGDEGDDGFGDEGDDGSDDDGDDEIDDVDDEDGQGDSEDDEDGQGDSEDDEDTEVRLFRLTFDGEKHFMGSIDHLEEHGSVQELVQHILPRLRLVRYGRPDGHTFIFSDHGGSYFEIDEAMGLRWEHFVDMLRAVYVDDQYDEEVMRLEALDVVEIREDNTWFYVGSVFMASSLAELERGVSDVRAELPHAYGLCVYTSHEKFPFGWPGEVLARRSWGWEWVLKNVTMVYFQ